MSGGHPTFSRRDRTAAPFTSGRRATLSEWRAFTKKKNDGIDVEGRIPGFFLYPADLERELQPLPIGAQGVWIRMLLRMHWAPRRGYLEHPTGKAFTEEDISRMVGVSKAVISNMLYDMEYRYGTFSRDQNGVIFNRRMVRDTEISLKRKEAGSKGGNPVLVGTLVKQNENLNNQDPNQNAIRGYTRARGSFSSSSSTTDDKKNGTHKPLTTIDDKTRYETPRDELVALMQSSMRRTPEVKVVRLVCEQLEIRGGSLAEFIADIRPRISRLREPPAEGFFLSEARKWGSSDTAPAPDPEVAIERTPTGRCSACNGVGICDGAFCKCKMGADLRAIDARKKPPQQETA